MTHAIFSAFAGGIVESGFMDESDAQERLKEILTEGEYAEDDLSTVVACDLHDDYVADDCEDCCEEHPGNEAENCEDCEAEQEDC